MTEVSLSPDTIQVIQDFVSAQNSQVVLSIFYISLVIGVMVLGGLCALMLFNYVRS